MILVILIVYYLCIYLAIGRFIAVRPVVPVVVHSVRVVPVVDVVPVRRKYFFFVYMFDLFNLY